MEKKCFKCGEIKPLTEFYKHPQMADGHVNKCKYCNLKDVKGNYVDNLQKPGYIEKERKRGRNKHHRLYSGTPKQKSIQDNIRWQARFPEKRPASLLAAKLPKIIGKEKHHWSYNREHWLDILYFTKRHHMKAHRFLVYDQERMMYRRYDTNELLDTKEKHQSFIEWCIESKED